MGGYKGKYKHYSTLIQNKSQNIKDSVACNICRINIHIFIIYIYNLTTICNEFIAYGIVNKKYLNHTLYLVIKNTL